MKPKKRNICKGCQHEKDRHKESCSCLMYGIIVTYGKETCNGYKKKEEHENE